MQTYETLTKCVHFKVVFFSDFFRSLRFFPQEMWASSWLTGHLPCHVCPPPPALGEQSFIHYVMFPWKTMKKKNHKYSSLSSSLQKWLWIGCRGNPREKLDYNISAKFTPKQKCQVRVWSTFEKKDQDRAWLCWEIQVPFSSLLACVEAMIS